jgi:hypothetical protein
MSGRGQEKSNNDNKSDQCNPNNDKHQGHQSDYFDMVFMLREYMDGGVFQSRGHIRTQYDLK